MTIREVGKRNDLEEPSETCFGTSGEVLRGLLRSGPKSLSNGLYRTQESFADSRYDMVQSAGERFPRAPTTPSGG